MWRIRLVSGEGFETQFFFGSGFAGLGTLVEDESAGNTKKTDWQSRKRQDGQDGCCDDRQDCETSSLQEICKTPCQVCSS